MSDPSVCLLSQIRSTGNTPEKSLYGGNRCSVSPEACVSLVADTLAVLMNMCQQITGGALSAYLPTFTSENGFKGANAQIATLAPYGAAIIVRHLVWERSGVLSRHRA